MRGHQRKERGALSAAWCSWAHACQPIQSLQNACSIQLLDRALWPRSHCRQCSKAAPLFRCSQPALSPAACLSRSAPGAEHRESYVRTYEPTAGAGQYRSPDTETLAAEGRALPCQHDPVRSVEVCSGARASMKGDLLGTCPGMTAVPAGHLWRLEVAALQCLVGV